MYARHATDVCATSAGRNEHLKARLRLVTMTRNSAGGAPRQSAGTNRRSQKEDAQ
jgi:hypothetical protein